MLTMPAPPPTCFISLKDLLYFRIVPDLDQLVLDNRAVLRHKATLFAWLPVRRLFYGLAQLRDFQGADIGDPPACHSIQTNAV